MAEILDFERINKEASSWSRETTSDLKSALYGMLNSKKAGVLIKSVRYSIRKHYGVADRISFKFEKHGVFVEKGVGNGYGITGPKTATAMLKRARHPKPWFNTTIEKVLPELANRLQIEITKEAMDQIRIR